MSAQPSRISADGHVHLYPGYRLDRAFDCLLSHLDRNAVAAWQGDPQDTVRLAFLAERSDCRFFEQMRTGMIDPAAAGLELLAPREETCLTLLHRGARPLYLVAGRQVVTRERLEVLGLAMREPVPNGLPAREAIERIVAAKGFPVIPWAPGKWLGARGRLVRRLLAEARPGALALGDSSLRPLGWPEPGPIREARRRGLAVLPGSDPLPLPDEESQMGAYGFVCEGPFDAEHPTESVRALLADPSAPILPAGRRNALAQVMARLYRLRTAKGGG